MTSADLDDSAVRTPDVWLFLDRALRGCTTAGAWARHAEHDLGVLRVGAEADLVVWSDDLYAHADPAAVLERQAAITVVGAEVGHDIGNPGGGARPGVGHGGSASCCWAHESHGVPA